MAHARSNASASPPDSARAFGCDHRSPLGAPCETRADCDPLAALMPVRTMEDCERRIADIYGRALDLTADCGVLHVTAVGRDPVGELQTIALAPGAPHSATDAFVLHLARARADAIVTTGRILRSEPRLRHAIGDDQNLACLAAWRRERLGKTGAPLSVVLTAGRELDWRHPLFHQGTQVAVVTSVSAARALRAGAPAAAELIARPEPGLRDTIELLRGRGHACVSIEAGPSSTADLYQPPLAVDELMLSVFEEHALPEALRAGRFLGEARLDDLFPHREGTTRLEGSGCWSFRRYWRG